MDEENEKDSVKETTKFWFPSLRSKEVQNSKSNWDKVGCFRRLPCLLF